MDIEGGLFGKKFVSEFWKKNILVKSPFLFGNVVLGIYICGMKVNYQARPSAQHPLYGTGRL